MTQTSSQLDRATNFNVLGQRNTSNNVSIDGIPVVDIDNGVSKKMNVNMDSVAEVKILLSNYQAEYGRNAGSNVHIVTKSGGQEFHGIGSYFKRHEQFNATNFFDNRNGVKKPRVRYNTWTYNIGGPIYIPGKFNADRRKLFFFWGQEFWPIQEGLTGRVTMPTALERQGDFSQSLDLNNRVITITDPDSGKPFAEQHHSHRSHQSERSGAAQCLRRTELLRPVGLERQLQPHLYLRQPHAAALRHAEARLPSDLERHDQREPRPVQRDVRRLRGHDGNLHELAAAPAASSTLRTVPGAAAGRA